MCYGTTFYGNELVYVSMITMKYAYLVHKVDELFAGRFLYRLNFGFAFVCMTGRLVFGTASLWLAKAALMY